MSATNQSASAGEYFRYFEQPWGDLIYASKSCLQTLGIGVGAPFPGDPGGPKRCCSFVDPRGFPCKVSAAAGHGLGSGIFVARIEFPDRCLPDHQKRYFAPGVYRETCIWTDDFVGSAADLVACGLVPADCFPGLPGMNKEVVTILPDGSLLTGRGRRPVETRRILRQGKRNYRVSIKIPDELGQQRLEEYHRDRQIRDERLMALPRPPRIDGPLVEARQQAMRKKISLVYSRPPFVPGLNMSPPDHSGR